MVSSNFDPFDRLVHNRAGNPNRRGHRCVAIVPAGVQVRGGGPRQIAKAPFYLERGNRGVLKLFRPVEIAKDPSVENNMDDDEHPGMSGVDHESTPSLHDNRGEEILGMYKDGLTEDE